MSATQATLSPAPIVPPTQQANSFSLSGHGLHVDYAATSFTGQPRLSYQDGTQTRSFAGSEIDTVEVPALGRIVSVTLSMVPDVGSTTFSVLIPTVMVSGIGGTSQVSTEAVTTIHRTPFTGHFVGQRELYRTARLHGSATALVF